MQAMGTFQFEDSEMSEPSSREGGDSSHRDEA